MLPSGSAMLRLQIKHEAIKSGELPIWKSFKIRNIPMYRQPKFLEVLHAIREEMSREADYDVDLFAEMVRSGMRPPHGPERVIRGFKTRAPSAEAELASQQNVRQRKRVAQ